MFVSYAQNFEDVMLHRAFAHLESGFYIDVGAAHPDFESVTRAFYDRNWRGINVEPCAEFHLRLAAARPQDINLPAAAGDGVGTVDFYEIQGSGLSTLNPSIAALHAKAGWRVEPRQVAQTTLAEICRQHAPPDIHFLKIDVEGSEQAVLAGADLRRFRPWIVLVGAVRPASQQPDYAAWEPILLAAGYRFVWFDGLNRFYVAAERYDALHAHFLVPPNVFDNFLRRGDSRMIHAQRADEADSCADQADVLAADARIRQAAIETQLNKLKGTAALAEAARARAEAKVGKVEVARAALQSELETVYASTSWRITRPLRALRWLSHGRLGVALIELGVPRQRAERLRLIWAINGSYPKRVCRLSVYFLGRIGDRARGSSGFGSGLRRVVPSAWRWLEKHDEAYRRVAAGEVAAMPAENGFRHARPGSKRKPFFASLRAGARRDAAAGYAHMHLPPGPSMSADMAIEDYRMLTRLLARQTQL